MTSAPDLFDPPLSNISIGNWGPVITNEQPDQLQLFQFGMTPSWAKKKMYLFNARSEGDNNKANDPDYTGGMGIISKPSFRTGIRKKRCLVVVDAFIEGSKKEKLSKPYLIYMKERSERPFALAGIWDVWVDKETGEVTPSFSIITTVVNDVTKAIGHHRSPVILNKDQEKLWLSDIPLTDVTSMLLPYPDGALNAYPISPAIKNPRDKDVKLLQPTGERVFPEFEYEIHRELKLEGMGMTNARKRKNVE